MESITESAQTKKQTLHTGDKTIHSYNIFQCTADRAQVFLSYHNFIIVLNVLNRETDVEEMAVIHLYGITEFICRYGGVKKRTLIT
jgi:hypothetical protein